MTDTRAGIRAKILANIAVDQTTSCWTWQGPTSGDSGRGSGYPRMKLRGQTVAVHRVMFVNEFGYVPGKKQIDHPCRNRLCVNPDHLEMVTQKENCRRRDRAKEPS